MNIKKKYCCVFGCALLCTGVLSVSTALAQGRTEMQSSRAEYQPLGIRAGGMIFHPLIELKGAYDDNIYKIPKEIERDDYILHISPSIKMASDWNRHALNASASLDLAYHDEYTGEDFNDWTLATDGRIDVLQNSFFTGEGGYSYLHEDRNSLDSRSGIEPTTYDFAYLGLGYDHTFNRMGVKLAYNYEMLAYDNVESFFGGTINNEDRDRDRNEVTLRVGYEMRPQFSLYIEGQANMVDYDQQFDRTNRQRSSDGYRAVAGLSIDLTAVLEGDIFLGYLSQTYDDPLFNGVDGVAYGFGLTWYPTDITILKASLGQTPQEITDPSMSGYMSTIFTAEVDHELMRNIILFGDLAYTDNSYERSVPGLKEKDSIFGIGGGLKYLITRNFYASVEYNYERRDSDLITEDYTDNMAMLTLGAQL